MLYMHIYNIIKYSSNGPFSGGVFWFTFWSLRKSCTLVGISCKAVVYLLRSGG